ncbi:MAG: RNA degradosome polyphosphate kinase, partial [Dolichospermum sp.]
LNDPQYYINRELSWLEFNHRVLHEACDPRTPLLERLKFLAIFSSNLDEFFMVRVAGLKQQVEATVNLLTADGRTPQKQLDDIRLHLIPQLKKLNAEFEEVLRPVLVEQGIYILDYIQLNEKQRGYLDNYFEEQVFPVLTPLA